MFFTGKKKEKPIPPAVRMWNGKEICPYLGLLDSPETFCGYPSYRNQCHVKEKRPQSVSLEHQKSFCMNGNYRDCEALKNPDTSQLQRMRSLVTVPGELLQQSRLSPTPAVECQLDKTPVKYRGFLMHGRKSGNTFQQLIRLNDQDSWLDSFAEVW